MSGGHHLGSIMTPAFTPFNAQLRDRRAVHVRTAGPDDEAAYVAAFEKLGPDARYMRFMRAVHEPNRKRLHVVLASFPERGFAIVATAGEGPSAAIVGSALCMVDASSTGCEFAMTVLQEYGGAGLGRVLLSALIDAARARGLKEMSGYVLATNAPMLALARKLGFTIAPDPDDPAARICQRRL